MYWTEDKIKLLAPDNSTERRGRMLASSSKWTDLSTNYEAIWGDCTVLDTQRFSVQIQLKGLKYRCSCSSKNNACKHIIGLLYLYVKSSALFKHQPPSEQLTQWLRSEKLMTEEINKQPKKLIKTEIQIEKARIAKEKRWQKRLDLMSSGIEELEVWLTDIIRQGIANTNAENADFWNDAAAKMVNAKLPGISTYLKETYQLILQDADWTELLVSRLGQLYFWVTSFRNRLSLSAIMLEDLYRSLGKTQKRAEIIAEGPLLYDDWLITGIKEGKDVENRTYRRVWLQGKKTNKDALLYESYFGHIGFDNEYKSGWYINGKLAYYSKNYPQRATFEHFEITDLVVKSNFRTYNSINSFMMNYTEAKSTNPWLSYFPVFIGGVSALIDSKNNLRLIDSDKNLLNLAEISTMSKMKILSVSGGHPILLFGEWDGLHFEPLSIFNHSKFISL